MLPAIVMALVAMMATAYLGMGLFAAPAMIAGIVLGPQAAMNPGFMVIVVGLMLHMALSMMFGVPFVFLALRVRTSIVGLGLGFGLLLWIIDCYVLSFVSPGARALAAHERVWLAIGTDLVLGVILGAIIDRATESSTAFSSARA